MKRLTNKAPAARNGFTFIEIAIVLVIIGLLLGGVLQGQQLMENSRVKSAINSFNGISTGAFSYEDRYDRLPGDDGDKAVLTARGATWTNVAPGNTNGLIDAAAADTFTGFDEGAAFFQQLRAAGFVAGNPESSGAAALPENPFGGLIGITTETINGGLNGTKICMSNVSGSAAATLDTQLDDGNGASGRLRGTMAKDARTAPAAVALDAAYTDEGVYTVCYRI